MMMIFLLLLSLSCVCVCVLFSQHGDIELSFIFNYIIFSNMIERKNNNQTKMSTIGEFMCWERHDCFRD